jgi:hypothetical protein
MQGDQVLEYAVAELQEGVRRLAAAQPRAN